MDKAQIFGLVGSFITLLILIAMLLFFPLLNDMTPADPTVQAAETLNSIILVCGALVITGFGFTGSLLLFRNLKLSRIFLAVTAVPCWFFGLVVIIRAQSIFPDCLTLIPAILFTIAFFLSAKSLNQDDSVE